MAEVPSFTHLPCSSRTSCRSHFRLSTEAPQDEVWKDYRKTCKAHADLLQNSAMPNNCRCKHSAADLVLPTIWYAAGQVQAEQEALSACYCSCQLTHAAADQAGSAWCLVSCLQRRQHAEQPRTACAITSSREHGCGASGSALRACTPLCRQVPWIKMRYNEQISQATKLSCLGCSLFAGLVQTPVMIPRVLHKSMLIPRKGPSTLRVHQVLDLHSICVHVWCLVWD